LNHGLTFSGDGKTLYASNVMSVMAWDYDAKAGTVSGGPRTVVTNMSNNDHTTRTLLMSKRQDGMLIVSRGSDENFDIDALDASTGLSQIKVFDLTKLGTTPYNFNTDGRRMGWGLRNAVGVAEEPTQGFVYSVENSIDDITRSGVDIHQNNPGEELNHHGKVTDTNQGGNYGYPRCFALWDTNIPNLGNLKVGSQFSMTQNATISDQICQSSFVPPRLTLPAHTAPLDMIFSSDGATAYISFHGSCTSPQMNPQAARAPAEN
jgi:glucose/arabinose dehydrogenase